MSITLEQVQQLYEHGLMGNINSLVSLMLSLPEFTGPMKDENNLAVKYQLTVYYADSLYEDGLYKRAEFYYNEASQLKKCLVKLKSKTNPKQHNLTPEVEIKYKIHLCYMKQDNHREGLSVLEGIPPKSRTPKVNMALGKLYLKHGMERSALTCYKEVLRYSPFALEAAIALLKLGVTMQEISLLDTGTTTTTKNAMPEWMTLYLKGYSFAALNKYTKAIQIYKSLETQLKGNTNVLCRLAECYYRNGEKQTAATCYEKIHSLDKNYLTGMDIYSQILASNSKKRELEKLAQELSEVSQIKTEPWIVMSYYCSCINQKAKAIYFAQKAHTTDTSNVQALTLKASLLKSLNKPEEAIIHFREAIRLAPNQLEAYEGLVECQTSLSRFKEAMNIARNAHKTVGSNPRTLTLCASVYSDESTTQEKAKTMLKKALNHDASYLPAVYQLCQILTKEEQYEEASQLLTKQLEMQQTATLHLMNADCLREMGKTSESMEQYNKALKLEPHNIPALDGIHYIEKDANSELDVSSMQEPQHRSSMEGLDTLGSEIRDNPWMY